MKFLAVRRSQYIGNFNDAGKANMKKRRKEGEKLLKLIYIIIEKLDIDMLQVMNSGDATNSLKWSGLNRKCLPSFTHQLVIVLIQKLIHSTEKEYASIIGHSE